jgi:hypothetical protein
MRNLTTQEIYILLHCYGVETAIEEQEANIKDTMRMLMKANLLRKDKTILEVTTKGLAFIKMLQCVPLPVIVHKWVDPREGDNGS